MPILDELHIAHSKARIDFEIAQSRLNIIKQQIIEAMQQEPVKVQEKKEEKK